MLGRETGGNHMTFCNLVVVAMQYYFCCVVFTQAVTKGLRFQRDGEDAPANGGVECSGRTCGTRTIAVAVFIKYNVPQSLKADLSPKSTR